MNTPEAIPNTVKPPSNTTGQPGGAPVAAAEPEMIKLKHLARLLNVPARWRILRELAKGEALPVKELAMRARCPAASASKHMALLKKAGVVVVGYGRLYKLSPGAQPDAEGRRLDLGHCVLKLDTAW